ncbi:MAG: hypothetical protein A2498_08105 [Lentisphaerae bacterium RIFOXYC12_FULL_60_16]|nr:MAG: hypothetical protein A2498_08105 [Lentisphaerae bacterium RIFOXYC12_FULL_60_16]
MQRIQRIILFLAIITAFAAPADPPVPLPGMVIIPAGTFEQGDSHNLAADARPIHAVDTDAFYMDRTEVTVEQAARVFDESLRRGWTTLEGSNLISRTNPARLLLITGPWPAMLSVSNNTITFSGNPAMPCAWITWHGALAYCHYRTLLEAETDPTLESGIGIAGGSCDFSRNGYRLPTEAEWEKAARGGLAGHHFPWTGNQSDPNADIDATKANYIDSGDPWDNGPSPAGYFNDTFAPINRVNLYGLRDMAGNLWEWCWDWYDQYAYERYPVNDWPPNPTGPPLSPWTGKVMRGGSWFTIPDHLRCAYRSYLTPGMTTPFTGFRTVRPVPGNRRANHGIAAMPPLPETRSEQIETDWFRSDALLGDPPDFEVATRRWLEPTRQALTMLERHMKDAAKTPESLPANFANPLNAFRFRLDSLDALLTQPVKPTEWKNHYLRIRRLRRAIVLASPQLDFDTLIAIHGGPPEYTSNICDQYLGRWSRPGKGLVAIDNWKIQPVIRTLTQPHLPTGVVQRFDLSFDAQHAVFSFCDHRDPDPTRRAFRLFEAELATGRILPLTLDEPAATNTACPVVIEDFDPCYLPDGGVAFVSTRCRTFSRCHAGRYAPSYVLYRIEKDGSNLRRLSFCESNEWSPAVLPDGSLMFTRWDYINRHEVLFQGLWTCRPDGSGFAHLYGNATPNPCVVAQAAPIPGSSAILALAAAHHSISCGSLIRVDPRLGEDGEAPLTRLTPELVFPETEGWPLSNYTTPYPLSEDLALVSFTHDRTPCHWEIGRFDAYGLYLFDRTGGRELIARIEDGSLLQPMPLRPRPTPPRVAGVLNPTATNAVIYLQNVYTGPHAIPPGSAKYLRVIRLFEQEPILSPPRSVVGIEIVKSVVGTVPFQPDGSTACQVPAGVPLLFQVLDTNRMAIMSMRSQVGFQPGETRGCVGCHENRRHASPNPASFPATRVQALTPVPGTPTDRGLQFARTVQPVLDRYCIQCHGLNEDPTSFNLLGTPTRFFSAAYESLVTRPGLVALAQRKQESNTSEPRDYGAHAGQLVAFLMGPHREYVSMDAGSLERIITWLDLNAPYYGDYAFKKPERRLPAEPALQALRDHLKTLNWPLLGNPDTLPAAALINPAAPHESRALKLPLAQSAGGWAPARPLWQNTNDPGYQVVETLVLETLNPDLSPIIPVPISGHDASAY